MRHVLIQLRNIKLAHRVQQLRQRLVRRPCLRFAKDRNIRRSLKPRGLVSEEIRIPRRVVAPREHLVAEIDVVEAVVAVEIVDGFVGVGFGVALGGGVARRVDAAGVVEFCGVFLPDEVVGAEVVVLVRERVVGEWAEVGLEVGVVGVGGLGAVGYVPGAVAVGGGWGGPVRVWGEGEGRGWADGDGGCEGGGTMWVSWGWVSAFCLGDVRLRGLKGLQL